MSAPQEDPAEQGDEDGAQGRDEIDEDWERLLARLHEPAAESGWITLAEATNATGVSRSTLRSWYRSGQLPSRMVSGIHGLQRLVPLDAVLDRAMRSARTRRQLEQARSLEAEVESLRRRVEALERRLGID